MKREKQGSTYVEYREADPFQQLMEKEYKPDWRRAPRPKPKRMKKVCSRCGLEGGGCSPVEVEVEDE